MRPRAHFKFCPRCATAVGADTGVGAPFVCERCEFTFYFNAAIAAAVYITRADGRVLLIERAKDPGKGMLAPPGGFVDIGERAEVGLCREVLEEVGLELANVRFLCSQPNDYLYKGVNYPVLDFFFTAEALNPGEAKAMDDVRHFHWLAINEVSVSALAFPSMRLAWNEFLQKTTRKETNA